MSRVATPSTSPQVKVPQEKIAQRAYEKWMKSGMKHGRHEQDWLEAEAELRVELARGGSPAAAPTRR